MLLRVVQGLLSSVLGCAFVCGALAMSPLTLAAEKLPSATRIRACSLPLPPQTMLTDGKPDGFAVKILEAVASKLHWQLEFFYSPWLRVVEDAKQGECDVVLTVLDRDDYASYMVFPKVPVLSQENVLVVKRGSGIQYNGVLESFMRAHTIGLYRDKAVDQHFESLRRASWARIELANSSELVMRMLFAGRFDAAIENSLTAVYELNRLGRLADAELLSPPLNVTPAYITFPKAGKALGLIGDFDAALSAFKRSNEFHVLEKRYLGR